MLLLLCLRIRSSGSGSGCGCGRYNRLFSGDGRNGDYGRNGGRDGRSGDWLLFRRCWRHYLLLYDYIYYHLFISFFD
jgi:hypothetical protein